SPGDFIAGTYQVDGVSGAAVLHRRAMLDDVARHDGGRTEWLPEDLVAYFEDVELDLRARLRGWTARYAPEAVGRPAPAGRARAPGALGRALAARARPRTACAPLTAPCSSGALCAKPRAGSDVSEA
ncbi:MAG: hypothetical protein ACO3OO_11845, partial [Gemmobacter sp.]